MTDGIERERIEIGCAGDWACSGELIAGRVLADVPPEVAEALERAWARDGSGAEAQLPTGEGGEIETWSIHLADETQPAP